MKIYSKHRRSLSWSVFIALLLVLAACSEQVVPVPDAQGDNPLLELMEVAPPPSITPPSVEFTIIQKDSQDQAKAVQTPFVPPDVDVCLLEDETGSFFDDIGNLQTPPTASDIFDAVAAATQSAHFAVAGFRDYPVSPYGDPGDWVYRLLSGMNGNKAAWLAGIAGLSAGGGNDEPEAQYDAIVAAAGPGTFSDPTLGDQNNCGWRSFAAVPNLTRVLVVIGLLTI